MLRPAGTAAAWAGAVALPAGTTAVALGIRALVPVPDLQMLYLLAVIVAAVRFGRGPALLTSALSIAAYDFLFVPPYFTFRVADARYVLTFAMLFGVGWAAGTFADRARAEERERLRLAQEAEAAALKAKTEQMRSALLSAVSHDLRSPLSAITGAATTLRDTTGLPEQERSELIESICEEAERMETLVANLLDMTRLEAGALKPRCEWVPVEEMIGSALGRLESRLRGREVTVDVQPGLPLLFVDPVVFGQVFVNLLENAARYTPPGSAVELRARVDGERVVIEVSDRGPGIPAGAGDRVFEKFFRGHHAGVPGAGLGLSICKGIVEVHGGRIAAIAREGGGATFRIVLPRPSEQPQ